eukprot:gene15302-18122_t
MLFSYFCSIATDAAVITTGLAAVRHFTGFSVHRVAHLIKNDSAKKAVLVYLNSGELIFDKASDVIKTQTDKLLHDAPPSDLNRLDSNAPLSPPPHYKIDSHKEKKGHNIKIE